MAVDIGAGDGLFVYRSAQAHPGKFFIGIDANSRPLAKISEKIYRQPSKGGLPNALFVQAAVEALPHELNGIASEIHVNLPWGSLLSAVAGGNATSLNNIRRICSVGAFLKVIVALDPERDRAETGRLELPVVSAGYVHSTLAALYRNAGFEIVKCETLGDSDWSKLNTSWAKRLRRSATRSGIRMVARANEGG